MRHSLIPLAAIASLLTAPVFAAGSTSGTLTVRATVEQSCVVDTSGGAMMGNALLDFGTVSNLSTYVDADTSTGGNADLAIVCSNGTDYEVTADLGSNPDDLQRRMKGGTEFLPYNLYSDAVRETPIEDAVPFHSGTGTGVTQYIPIYGRIPAGVVLPAAGLYEDLVTLTVNY